MNKWPIELAQPKIQSLTFLVHLSQKHSISTSLIQIFVFLIEKCEFKDGNDILTEIFDTKSPSLVIGQIDFIPKLTLLKYCSFVSIANEECFLNTVLIKRVATKTVISYYKAYIYIEKIEIYTILNYYYVPFLFFYNLINLFLVQYNFQI